MSEGLGQDHDARVLKRMIVDLENYKSQDITLRQLVDRLEGGLRALENKPPAKFSTQFYDYWGGLEQYLAAGTESVRKGKIIGEVNSLIMIIENELVNK